MNLEWRSTDPRLTINKRATIVILRPAVPGIPQAQGAVAYVDTKENWTVFTSFEEPYHHLGADADWPEDWQWIFAPE